MRNLTLIIVSVFLLLSCSQEEEHVSPTQDAFLGMLGSAVPQTQEKVVTYSVTTSILRGRADIYALADGEPRLIDSLEFYNSPIEGAVRYHTKIEDPSAIVFFHLYDPSQYASTPSEQLCLIHENYDTRVTASRITCDAFSTIAFYLNVARSISGKHPFDLVDIETRASLWNALLTFQDNDLIHFFAGVFNVLNNSILHYGRADFTPNTHSFLDIQKVMIPNLLNLYQVTGKLTGADVIAEATRVTGSQYPLARLLKYESELRKFTLDATSPSDSIYRFLDLRNKYDSARSSNVFEAFFLRGATLTMKHASTHVVKPTASKDTISWSPLPHMSGYNIYNDGKLYAHIKKPSVQIPFQSKTISIAAIGNGSEYSRAVFTPKNSESNETR